MTSNFVESRQASTRTGLTGIGEGSIGLISVIVPAHNARRSLPACLAALHRQTYKPDEIIVVDDGSTDQTLKIALEHGAYVLRENRRGPAAARNAGVWQAQGDIVLFTDADCEPEPDWIEQMVSPLADPAVVGVKGAYRTHQRNLIARLVQAEFEEKYARLSLFHNIDFIDTYSAAYRREAFLQAGGFNEIFPSASVEDIEFSFRLSRQGAHLRFAPQARVWHTHPTSLFHYLRRKARYGFWRALVYLWHPKKMGGDSHTDPMLKVQFAFVALGSVGMVLGVINAHLFFVTALAALGLAISTLPFVERTWKQDYVIALLAIPIHMLRAGVQAVALAAGFVVHGGSLRMGVGGNAPMKSQNQFEHYRHWLKNLNRVGW